MTLHQPIQLTQMPQCRPTRSGERQREDRERSLPTHSLLTAEEVEDVVAAVRVVVDTVLHQNLKVAIRMVKVHNTLMGNDDSL